MGHRRKSRETAMQALFFMDIDNSPDVFDLFCKNFEPSGEILPFFEKLVQGVVNYKTEIDNLVERFSSNWKISRMSGVDRNIIRIAVFELLYCSNIPYKVSINEAVEIGKKFGNIDSGGFINGIIDSIRLFLEKNKSNGWRIRKKFDFFTCSSMVCLKINFRFFKISIFKLL